MAVAHGKGMVAAVAGISVVNVSDGLIRHIPGSQRTGNGFHVGHAGFLLQVDPGRARRRVRAQILRWATAELLAECLVKPCVGIKAILQRGSGSVLAMMDVPGRMQQPPVADVPPDADAHNGLEHMIKMGKGEAGRSSQITWGDIGAQMGFDGIQTALNDVHDFRCHTAGLLSGGDVPAGWNDYTMKGKGKGFLGYGDMKKEPASFDAGSVSGGA